MKACTVLILTACLIGVAATAFAQEEDKMDVTQLAEHIYELSYDGGGYMVKVIASVGDDGVLLVDAGQKDSAEKVKATLQTLKDETPKIIISTHDHVEHIEGNAIFKGEPLIIGHTLLPIRLKSGIHLFDEFPEEAMPDLTFDDSISLKFNGEEIKIIACTGAHTDNDIIVWFTESKVACVGAICNGTDFPSVDRSGDVLKYADVAGRVIDMLPDDTRIIPGHGRDCTMDEFRAFRTMLMGTTEIVKKGLAQGKDLAALQQEKVLIDYESWGGSYTSMDQWIKYLVGGLTGEVLKQTPYEPMYYAIADKGAGAAVDYYFDFKSGNDEYDFRNTDLVFIAYKLYGGGRTAESIPFFERSLKEYPDGEYTELSYTYLGRAYNAAGDAPAALKNYKMALAMNPENSHAAEMVEKLEKK
jgi:glyoxylase-like metal-dependent hydrolase (beta-lactamase superfamily II)